MSPPGEVRLQPLVRARVASLGDRGAAWVSALPALLAELAERWSLRLGRALPGGSASYLTTAVRADGTEAVLKVSVLPVVEQAAVLRRADGQGYVRLLKADPSCGALLMERLGASLDGTDLPVETQLDLLATTLNHAWLAPDRPPSDKAGDLARDLVVHQDRTGHAAGLRALEQALAYADELRATDPPDLALLHGDAHPGNLLRLPVPRPGAETGWCFVDPDPFVADRTYDVGVTVRDFSVQLMAGPDQAATRLRAWCERVATATGTDPARVWAWGFLERVSTGLYVASFGAHRVAEPFLRSADLLVGQRGI